MPANGGSLLRVRPYGLRWQPGWGQGLAQSLWRIRALAAPHLRQRLQLRPLRLERGIRAGGSEGRRCAIVGLSLSHGLYLWFELGPRAEVRSFP